MNLGKFIAVSALSLASLTSAFADDYVIDTENAHASIVFRFKHLGYSWLSGRFNTFDGVFSYDADDLNASTVQVNIDVNSIDTNNTERDKHMRSDKYLNAKGFPTATFASTRIDSAGDSALTVTGDLTLHGVTRKISFPASKTGEGKDPWGGYRAGFEGHITLDSSEFGFELPPANEVELSLYLEGIKKK